MSNPHSSHLLARIRASTRFTVLVLLIFVMKVGLVAACAAHESEQGGREGATATSAIGTLSNESPTDGEKPAPLQHAGCVDCHCHHAAALLPELAMFNWVPAAAEPANLLVLPRAAVPARELRPPIA